MKLYYKFSPLLIQYIPKDTVRAWISQGKKLDPKRLIPALVQYDHKKYSEQVRGFTEMKECPFGNIFCSNTGSQTCTV
jgi:hypothetical protein